MKIKSIKRLEPQLTVDIEVASTHSYQLSNGVVSHNTVSQLVDAASGIHPRYSKYYIRTVRADKKDPVAKFMRAAGFPVEDDITKPNATDVFAFPMKAPAHAVTREELGAIDQLKLWLTYQRYWCEHKPSITVYVKESEWMEVGSFVYKYFDEMSGVSFLPHTEHTYKQAPYQEIDEETFNQWVTKMPKEIDWEQMAIFEQEDQTTSSHELACTGGTCELSL